MAEDDDWEADELDLEAVEREAAKVERRALDLDFSDVVPEAASSGLVGRRHGAATLETDTFFSQKDREAMDRARGGTPTLAKLGKQAPRAARPDRGDARLPMDTELRISSRGLPGWAWAVLVIVLIAVGVGLGGLWLHDQAQDSDEGDVAALEAARARAQAEEEARLRRLQQGD